MKKIAQENILVWLIVFAMFLSFLFVYQMYSQKSKHNYHTAKEQLSTMQILNLELSNFIETEYKFTNFDIIAQKVQNFKEALKLAKQNAILGHFSNEVLTKMNEAGEIFNKKEANIERFKSRQVSNLNSIHYLFELSDKIVYDNLDINTRHLIHDTIFAITKKLINVESLISIEENVKKLKQASKKLNINGIDLFLLHANSVLESSFYLDKTQKEIRKYKLRDKINAIDKMLVFEFNQKLLLYNFISTIFFISLLLIVLLVYQKSKKMQKTKNELTLFRHAIEDSDNSIVLTDKDRRIVYVNNSFKNTTGYSMDEVIGENPRILQSNLTPQKVYDDLNKQLNAGKRWDGEFINMKKDGTLYHEKASIVPIYMHKELKNFLAIKLDITKYIEQKKELQLSDIVFDNMQEGVLVCDKDKKILTSNKGYETIMGYSKDELMGNIAYIFSKDYKDNISQKSIIYEIKTKGYFRGKIINKTKKGQDVYVWANISTIKDEKNEILKYVIVYTSLEEIMEYQRKTEELAYYDYLTKLPNTVKLKNDLIKIINSSKVLGSSFFLLFIDLDRFKNVNDTLGHSVGDHMLQIVANRIQKLLLPSDILSRFGGDEFVVVLDKTRDKKHTNKICIKILDSISQTITIQNHPLNTSASIGVVHYPQDGDNYESLIKNADIAMYHAKRLGKNTFSHYSEDLSVRIKKQSKMERALKQAIEKGEFYLNYQPQYNIKTKKILSIEALLRWNSPTLGFIPPNEFIPIAEDTRKIIEIGKMVLDMACRDFADFKKVYSDLNHIAINISSIQFSDENFINDICQIVHTYGLSPREVELEITERCIMESTQENSDLIRQLRSIGFRFSIDDFGTGYSSLGYLTQFPMDIIKIDKSFVDGIPKNASNMHIAKAIVVLSRSLNCLVVAEGIEFNDQEEYLSSIKCTIGQGYLFSKPLSYHDTIALLEKQTT